MKKTVSLLLCFILCITSMVSFAEEINASIFEVNGQTEYAAGELATPSPLPQAKTQPPHQPQFVNISTKPAG